MASTANNDAVVQTTPALEAEPAPAPAKADKPKAKKKSKGVFGMLDE